MQTNTTERDPNPEYSYLLRMLQGFPKARVPSLEEFEAVSLRAGKGSGKEGDHCALQVVRRWEGLDAESDTVPATDSQVCGRFLIRFQDAIKDDATRSRLCRPLMVKLVGSAGSAELEQRRSWLAVDWALREVAPLYFDMSPELATHAAALRALPPITSRAAATAAYSVRDAARSAAWELRQARLLTFREKFRAEFAKRMPAEAAAVAAAAVEAAEAAVEAAEAAAAAAAVAVEAAVEAAEAAGSDRYWEIRNAVYNAVRKHFRETMSDALKSAQLSSWESGARCLDRMLDAREETSTS